MAKTQTMNFSKKTTLSICLFSLLILGNGISQQRFRAGLVAGLNASQILGDNVGGYNRLGVQGGMRALAVLTDRTDISFEILYSQRGSYNKDGSPVCYNGPVEIATRYIEVPVLFSFKDWLNEEEDYYRIQASAGFSFGRLMSASSIGSCHDDLTDLFSKNDFSFTCGAEYFSSKRLSFGMRWSRSINWLYNRKKGDALEPNPRNENSLRGFFLSFRTAYIF